MVQPVGELVQHRQHPDRRSYVGKGKLDELKAAYKEAERRCSSTTSSTQLRTLENALDARVIDRTQLILDIFAQHAVTAEGKLQVVLAQLEYNPPRMRGMSTSSPWRRTGAMRASARAAPASRSSRATAAWPGGGSPLKRRLETVERQRQTRRKQRIAVADAGRRARGVHERRQVDLLNALTGAERDVEDRLFETLDPTTRAFEEDGRRYLVTDTVGFIRVRRRSSSRASPRRSRRRSSRT